MPLKAPSSTSIDAIHAKVHARRAEMREKEKLAHLCELKGIANLAAELYPEQGIQDHRHLQKRLAEDSLMSLDWIMDFLGGREFKLFSWLLRRYQIENIKVVFRGFHGKRQPSEIEPHLVKTPPDFALPYDNMITAPNTAKFVDLVPDYPLGRAVRQAILLYNRKNKPFFFDAALDRAFYVRLVEMIRGSYSPQVRSCMPLLMMEVGIYLIMLTLRARNNYEAAFDDISPVLKVDFGLPMGVLQNIYSAGSAAEAARGLPIAFRAAITDKVESIDDIERMLMTHLYRQANRTFYAAGVALSAAIAFFYLKRNELANLVRLSEAYHYGLKPEEMKRILVPPVE